MKEKNNKLLIPATIILIGLILGSFYYFAEINKQKISIDKEKLRIEQEEYKLELLNQCLYQVKDNYSQLTTEGTEYCNNLPNVNDRYQCGINLFDKMRKGIEKDKEECFRKYPQN